MSFDKFLAAAATVVVLTMGASQMAFAADSCEAQVKALTPTVASVTDAATKEKASKLLEKANSEATEEFDEEECLDYLKDAKELLGIQ